MNFSHESNLALDDVLQVTTMHLKHNPTRHQHGIAERQRGRQPESLHTMINNLDLLTLLRRDPVSSLKANHRVPDRNRQSLTECKTGITNNVGTDGDHGRVVHLGVLGRLVLAFACDLGVAHHHLRAWDTDIMDAEEPIVDGVEANLVAQVTQLDARHRGMSAGGTDLEQEGMDAIVLTVKDQTGVDGTVGAGLGQGARPPFH